MAEQIETVQLVGILVLPGCQSPPGLVFASRPASIRMYESLPDCQLIFCSVERKDVGMQFGQDKACHSLLLEEGLGIVARPRQGLAERAGRGALTGGHDA